jgi:poly(A) polymerase
MVKVLIANTKQTVQPRIYSVEEHHVSADQIDPNASYVILKLRQAGYKAYLVGGGVRDLLLKQKPKDFDISTSAKPEEIKALFRNAILIGRRFRLAHIRFGKKIIEVAFRSGDPESTDLIVRDNVWGTEEEDVMRRDFTINGLLYDLENETIIDYIDGYPDIAKKTLRIIGQPENRFVQDPVRMIRLIKFCARFDFHIDPPTFKALLSCKNEIIKSSSARILEELLRMLESSSSKAFFHLLHEYGLLRPLLPTLASYFEENAHNEILALLYEADTLTMKKPIDRSILISLLIFPLFRHRLYTLSQTSGKQFHLGTIQEEAGNLIDETFDHFFLLPRKMRSLITSILTQQYRIQPLDNKPPRKPRPPKDPSFPYAMQLFKLRTFIQPDLLDFYTAWTEAGYDENAPMPEIEEEDVPRRRRRRR